MLKGQHQEPTDQTPITNTLARPKKMKNNPSKKPKPRRTLDLNLPPIPISAGNASVSMETSPSGVAREALCEGDTVAFHRAQMENPNPVTMRNSSPIAMETLSHVSMEIASRAPIQTAGYRSPSHISMVTRNNVTIETSKEFVTESLNGFNSATDDSVSMQKSNQVSMTTSNCVPMETLNGVVMVDKKCEENYSSSPPISCSISQLDDHMYSIEENNYYTFERKRKFHQSDQEANETRREPFTQKENDYNTITLETKQHFNTEMLSPVRINPNQDTPNVRLPGMECFIKNFNINNSCSNEKENGCYDAMQYHCNSWMMGFDDQQFPMTLWRPW